MDAARDLLDKQVVDRNGREMGRVDGVLLDEAHGRPLRLKAIVIGPSALAYRLHPALGRVAAAVEHALGLAGDRPTQIPIEQVTLRNGQVSVDVSISETSAYAVEQWLRRLVAKIPSRT
jgi:sporulation protein YlmC with PRC-barrel domain